MRFLDTTEDEKDVPRREKEKVFVRLRYHRIATVSSDDMEWKACSVKNLPKWWLLHGKGQVQQTRRVKRGINEPHTLYGVIGASLQLVQILKV